MTERYVKQHKSKTTPKNQGQNNFCKAIPAYGFIVAVCPFIQLSDVHIMLIFAFKFWNNLAIRPYGL